MRRRDPVPDSRSTISCDCAGAGAADIAQAAGAPECAGALGRNSNADEVRYNSLRTMEWRPDSSVSVRDAARARPGCAQPSAPLPKPTVSRVRGNSIAATRPAARSRLQVIAQATTSWFSPFFSFSAAMGFPADLIRACVDPAGFPQCHFNRRINFDGSLRPIGPARRHASARDQHPVVRPHRLLRYNGAGAGRRHRRTPCSSFPPLNFHRLCKPGVRHCHSDTSARWFRRSRDGFRARESEIQPIA